MCVQHFEIDLNEHQNRQYCIGLQHAKIREKFVLQTKPCDRLRIPLPSWQKNYITCSADLKKLYEAVTTFLLSSDLVMSCCHRRLMFSAQFHIASGSKWPSLMSFSARCFTSVALWHVFLNRGNQNVSKTFFTVSSDSETNHKHVWCKAENQSDLGTLGSKFTHLLTTSTQEPIQRC